MVIESTRFGSLEIDEKDVLGFPEGLPGFPAEKAFALIPYGPQSPFAFLQSVSEPDLTFLIAEPFAFFADYQFELADDLAASLGLAGKTLPQVFVIVTVPEKLEEMTANLLAPIVVNPRRQLAAQIVFDKTPYTTRHRLFPQGFPPKPLKEAK